MGRVLSCDGEEMHGSGVREEGPGEGGTGSPDSPLGIHVAAPPLDSNQVANGSSMLLTR